MLWESRALGVAALGGPDLKLLRYGDPGKERPALLDEDGRMRALESVVADISGAALLPDGLARIAACKTGDLPVVEGLPRIGPCVGAVRKFIGIGFNYRSHAPEMKTELPKEPVIFMKAPSCISGPYDDVVLPPDSRKLDWEVELGVVIGMPARRIAPENALRHVAGYCVVNDVSERHYQFERGGQFVKGKSCDSFGPVGPWLVTRDEIPDPQDLDLWLEVDGVTRQDGNTHDMIFGVAELVAYVSLFMTLEPGDVITTGTPAGVGHAMKPPVYLKEGNVMSLGVAGLGEQRQRVTRLKA